jgi:shikimate dehydrogenase
VILGAGGAAEAIINGLKEKNCNVTVINRTASKGKMLAQKYDVSYSSKIPDSDIIINCTPVGMDAKKNPIKDKRFLKRKVVMDIIYNPVETPLLKMAKKAGTKTVSGLDMFIYQAMEQQSIWTGKKVNPVTIRNILH